MRIQVNGLECTVTVREHDTSPTGLQYKVVVSVPKRLLAPRRRTPRVFTLNMPKPKPSKPKHDLGAWANDVGNALGRQLNFKYGWSPSIDKGYKGTTEFTFFFSDAEHAKALGLDFGSDAVYRAVLRHELQAVSAGYPAFDRQYRRVE